MSHLPACLLACLPACPWRVQEAQGILQGQLDNSSDSLKVGLSGLLSGEMDALKAAIMPHMEASQAACRESAEASQAACRETVDMLGGVSRAMNEAISHMQVRAGGWA